MTYRVHILGEIPEAMKLPTMSEELPRVCAHCKKPMRCSETPKELLVIPLLDQPQTQLKTRNPKGTATKK